MAGLPWPSGDDLLPRWTAINAPTGSAFANQGFGKTRGRKLAQERHEVAEAAALRPEVWNERRHTIESLLLRDSATWRPVGIITADDTAYTPPAPVVSQPATLTDDEIFAGGPQLLDHSSYLLQVAGTHRHQEILDKINAGHAQPILSRPQLDNRIRKAIDRQARLENRPEAELKAELKQARKASGVTHRTHLEIGANGRATRAANKNRKEAEAGSETLEVYGHCSTDGSLVPERRLKTKEVDEDEDDPLGDLDEMGQRVMRGSLSSMVDGSPNEVICAEQHVLRGSDQMSNRDGSTNTMKRKAYDYDRDGDTTDEETRAEQISRFQRRKIEGQKAASKKARQSKRAILQHEVSLSYVKCSMNMDKHKI